MAMGGAIKLKNGLTQKQNAFKNKVVKQIRNGEQVNGTAAVLEIYDVKDKNSAHVIASENLSNLTIQQIIDKELEAQGWNSTENLKEVIDLARSTPKFIPAGVKLQANIELLKLRGKYPGMKNADSSTNNQTTIINLTYNEAKQRTEQLSSAAQEFIQDAEAS